MAEQRGPDETLTRQGRAEAGGQPARAELAIVHPPALARAIELGAHTTVLGRRPEEQHACPIEHATVSRRHFAVRWEPERGLHVGRDLGSRNGSRVSGQAPPEQGVALAQGDVVRLGDVLLVYERRPVSSAADPPVVSQQAVPGNAAAMRRLRAALARAGSDPSPVLLVGETGTGKEYIARELHRLSSRPGPFVPVNSAALSPQLAESELFGHARGAFTGAQEARPGLFRAADGGTLFLDEVGELPLELQPKLLRALQERAIRPVGETAPVALQVRVLAATLREPTELVRAGRFRLDLYARLSLWEVRVPPLRERRVDVLDWVARLAERWQAERSGAAGAAPSFDADAAELLLLDPWPENLRGLNRLVHQICADPPGNPIGPAAVEPWLRGAGLRIEPGDRVPASASVGTAPSAAKGARRRRRSGPTPDELGRVLAECGGSVRAAAKHFGCERRQIYRWMVRYGLDKT
ncbi:MAG: sigma 54-interacting transcriptional regulator [Deltaproteobacteria bacterium]|nr:sigma 54-interacting transcriptional regulator [Deltaproteobacteria bacterium]